MSESVGARVIIRVVVETVSPMHIGDGGTVYRPGLEAKRKGRGSVKPVMVASVATAIHRERVVAAIPASAFRGAMRQIASATDVALANRVFGGTALAGPMAAQTPAAESHNYAGILSCWDGVCVPQHEPKVPPPFWCDERRTGVRASVAIDPVLGIAADGMLRHVELVPESERFELELSLRNPTLDDCGFVLALVNAVCTGFTALGSNTVDGWGRVKLAALPEILKADGGSISGWIASGAASAWTASSVPVDADQSEAIMARQAAYTERIRKPATTLSAEVSLCFSGPLMVADSSTKKVDAPQKADAPKEPDKTCMRDTQGRWVLPADSVRGRLREQATKIVRTRLQTTDLERDTLQLLDAIFGSTSSRSALSLTDFVAKRARHEAQKYEQPFVAIDRITGGSVAGRLFMWRSAWKPRLRGKLSFDVAQYLRAQFSGRADVTTGEKEVALRQAFALLALVLRDLTDGLIAFGAGAAKGYGCCVAKISTIRCGGEAFSPDLRGAFLVGNDNAFRPDDNTLSQWVSSLSVNLKRPTDGRLNPFPDRKPRPFQRQTATHTANSFRNPFHFVPFPRSDEGVDEEGQWTEPLASIESLKPLDDGPNALGRSFIATTLLDRSRSRAGTVSGALMCSLTIKRPTVVGGYREPREPQDAGTAIVPAAMTPDGRALVPGATIRGMISSTFETLSNSAARVLGGRSLSHRMRANQALPFIGMICADDSGRLQVCAVCNGPLSRPQQNRHAGNFPDARTRALFPKPNLRISLSGHLKDQLRAGRVGRQPLTSDYYGLEITDLDDWQELAASVGLHEHGQRILGRRPTAQARLRIWSEIPQDEQPGYLRGKLLVMAVEGREMPRGKTHEFFVPFPHRVEAECKRLPLPDEVLRTFYALADELFDKTLTGAKRLPYEPFNQGRNSDATNKLLRLKPGDLVWFDVVQNKDTQQYETSRVALSSIWRQAVKVGDQIASLRAFVAAKDFELLPFSPKRESISSAEALFGFTTEFATDGSESETACISGLASRLSFLNAEMTFAPPSGAFGPSVILRALMSPKPPAPELYFTPAAGRVPHAREKASLSARSLNHLDVDSLQGRKVYLHQSGTSTWISEQNDERLTCSVTPLNEETQFEFQIRFDSLSPRELAMLLFSIEPSDEFQHKLGLGKPLGLGSVKLQVSSLERFSAFERHTNGWAKPQIESLSREEIKKLRDSAAAAVQDVFPAVYRASLLLGESIDLGNVSYPVRHNQPLRSEANTFEWFQTNQNQHEVLKPLTEHSEQLPELPKH